MSFPDLSGEGEPDASGPIPPSAPRPVEDKNVIWTPKKEGTGADGSRSGGTILEVNQLRKGYVKGKNLIPVLNGVDIQVRDGEFLAVVGQSGSGKSTLLHLMGTLDVPDSGTVHFDGQRIDNLPSRRRDFLRNHYIGMIFQFYHLIPEMSMLENVLAPMMVRESLFGYLRRRRQYAEQAKELLNLVGLSHRIRHRPNELSGGEMQRTSIARALITNPRVLLADEPTGNLDSKTTVEIIKLLRSLNAEKKLTIIMVTHDMEQARDADRVVRLVDGQVVESFLTGV
ncbi:MAG: ABC transporter ATP-binding protein [Thermoguttaceae bacterium]|nr:ABC transporter ATP-binding protein [Thermoguttaceae bacterium]